MILGWNFRLQTILAIQMVGNFFSKQVGRSTHFEFVSTRGALKKSLIIFILIKGSQIISKINKASRNLNWVK